MNEYEIQNMAVIQLVTWKIYVLVHLFIYFYVAYVVKSHTLDVFKIIQLLPWLENIHENKKKS